MAPSLTSFSASMFPGILIAPVTLLVIGFLFTKITAYIRQRRIIKEHGCQPVHKYAHKGIGGKLFGLDVIREMIASGKEGRMHEASRMRNWNDPKITTQQVRSLTKDLILTIEPENVKAILATQFQDFGLGKGRHQALAPLFGNGIFTTDGHAWERSRGLIRPNFVRQQVADLDMFEAHVQSLIKAIPTNGGTVDLQDLFFALTIDTATEFLFGKSTNTLAPTSGLEAKRGKDFVAAFVYATESISREFRSAGLTRWIPNKKWNESVKVVHKFADDTIAEALREHREMKFTNEKKYTFLHELLNRTQDPITLRSELLNVLLAGRDTTAGLLTNTWHVLSKRPDIWQKLKKEVDGLGGARPQYSDIKEMKYLKYLFNESLRLMPVVPGNSREAMKDTTLPSGGGPDGKSPILVKKGQTVAYTVWSMHRRTDYYGEDALEFKPERWESLRPGWEYLP
jgi:cytochrome P450